MKHLLVVNLREDSMQPMCFSRFTCRMLLQKMPPGGRQTSWKHDFAAGLGLSDFSDMPCAFTACMALSPAIMCYIGILMYKCTYIYMCTLVRVSHEKGGPQPMPPLFSFELSIHKYMHSCMHSCMQCNAM